MEIHNWASWDLHGDVIAGVAIAALLYLLLAARNRKGGGKAVSGARAASFASGLFVILIALNGPLHALADHYLFSAHMVQHLLLTLVVPPLLLAGLPQSLIDPLPSLAGLLRRLTAPLIACILYNAILIVWHVPLFYGWAMENHAIHIGQHLLFLGSALLLWWPVAGPRLAGAGMPAPAQLLYLFLAGVPMILVAAFVTLADEPLYRFYALAPRLFGISPLDDQVAGGVIMWVPGSLVYLIAITVVYFRWVATESEESDGTF